MDKELSVRDGPYRLCKVVRKVNRGEFLIVQAKNLDFDKDPWFLLREHDGQQEWITGDPKSVRYINVESLAFRKALKRCLPTPTPTPAPLADNVRDFSTTQGATNWKYLVEDPPKSGAWREMQFGSFDGAQCWILSPSESWVRICRKGVVHPGVARRVAYEWRYDKDRQVRIKIHAHKEDTNCGNGVTVTTWRVFDRQGKEEKLGAIKLGGNDSTGKTQEYTTNVGPGILIYVRIDYDGDSRCDATRLLITIR